MIRRLWSRLAGVLRHDGIHPTPTSPLLKPTELDRLVLLAAAELLSRQQELIPIVTHALGTTPHEYWIGRRYCRSVSQIPPLEQRGRTADTEWEWFFHGLECDIWNARDGRFVRLDFGPSRNKYVFTSWGVMQFVMTSKPPWQTFQTLQAFIAEKPPPYDQFSGSDIPLRAALDRLRRENLVGFADPELCRAVEASTVRDTSGNSVIQLPKEIEPEYFCDAATCGRLTLTHEGTVMAVNVARGYDLTDNAAELARSGRIEQT